MRPPPALFMPLENLREGASKLSRSGFSCRVEREGATGAARAASSSSVKRKTGTAKRRAVGTKNFTLRYRFAVTGQLWRAAQLGLGVGEDPSMVKCEVNVAHIDPFGAHRVRPHAWPSSRSRARS